MTPCKSDRDKITIICDKDITKKILIKSENFAISRCNFQTKLNFFVGLAWILFSVAANVSLAVLEKVFFALVGEVQYVG